MNKKNKPDTQNWNVKALWVILTPAGNDYYTGKSNDPVQFYTKLVCTFVYWVKR